jgi:ADP-ribosyl-[dinitrogen reductase] hydrolase
MLNPTHDGGRILPRDRLMGGLVGLVVGDALGVPVEFSSRRERDHDPVRGLRGYGTHLQPVGAWSDDGALAMAHARAFIDHGWDPKRHLEEFLA